MAPPYGQLGQGSTTNLGDNPGEMTALTPVSLGSGRLAVAVSAGSNHTCALLDDATVKCWGGAGSGELGYGNQSIVGDGPGEMGVNLPAVDLGTGRTVKAVTGGANHTCALLDNGTVKCWGSGQYGQTGQGNTTNRGDGPNEMGVDLAAVDLGTGRTAVAVSAGANHTCALLDDATVKCWGGAGSGELGQGSQTILGDGPNEMGDNLDAVNLGSGRTATAVTGGANHTCAWLDDGTAKCWGRNQRGQLGQGSTTNLGDNAGEMAALGPIAFSAPSMTVVKSTTDTSVTVGAAISYRVTVNNTGNVALTNVVLTDANAPGCSKNVGTIQPGQSSATATCVHVTVPGDVGRYVNTATATSAEITTPVVSNAVTTAVVAAVPRRARAVATGQDHTCALMENGTVRCWGAGGSGQLGYGKTENVGDTAAHSAVAAGVVDLGPGRFATQVVAGAAHTCALLDNGRVRCWGLGTGGRLGLGNQASIGDDETPGSASVVDLGGHTALQISAGAAHTCAVLDDHTLRCWGEGDDYRLGYRNTLDIGDDEAPGSVGPVDLGTPRTATQVSAGMSHTCAVLDDQTLRCWGLGGHGRLGYANRNTVGDNESPGSAGAIDLGAVDTASSVRAADRHTCAVVTGASLRCWGDNNDGRLGYGNTTSIGDTETPGSVDPVRVGGDVAQVATGSSDSCVILVTGAVRCWGYAANGQLGNGNGHTDPIGDHEKPESVDPVDLGSGRTAIQVATAAAHTCAVLDDGRVRCWGYGGSGRLGYGNTDNIGLDQTPGSAGPVDLGLEAPSLAVALSAQETTVFTGDTIHYRVTVTNTGEVPLTGVAVTAANDTSCVLAVGAIAVGSAGSVDCSHLARQADVGTFANQVSVTSNELPTPAPSRAVNVTVVAGPTTGGGPPTTTPTPGGPTSPGGIQIGDLARTGSEPGPLVLLAVALIAVGVALTRPARRHR